MSTSLLKLVTLIATCCIATGLSAQQKPTGEPGFASPSGNILCYPLSWYGDHAGDGITCLIFDAEWEAAMRDPECGLDETNELSLPQSGPAEALMACHGDVFYPVPRIVLDYGEEAMIDGVTCRSETTGMRCENGDGYYIHLARRGYEMGKQ